MSNEEDKEDKKKNDYSFYKKVIFVAVVGLVIYYIISPYQNCMREKNSNQNSLYCSSDKWGGNKW